MLVSNGRKSNFTCTNNQYLTLDYRHHRHNINVYMILYNDTDENIHILFEYALDKMRLKRNLKNAFSSQKSEKGLKWVDSTTTTTKLSLMSIQSKLSRYPNF